ncbi:hypothetical protein BJ322DRAFT_229523 [Thelephora terrestris]|uniref:Uncharacterized protein n=1 Tax=Thelephora terrestris TaxID=56493 RepID=A0A9P6HB38_9AGAM|nr:hypothetical protein BJ322DRAFT_229523 [Thelephora terrestris]
MYKGPHHMTTLIDSLGNLYSAVPRKESLRVRCGRWRKRLAARCSSKNVSGTAARAHTYNGRRITSASRATDDNSGDVWGQGWAAYFQLFLASLTMLPGVHPSSCHLASQRPSVSQFCGFLPNVAGFISPTRGLPLCSGETQGLQVPLPPPLLRIASIFRAVSCMERSITPR